MLALLAPAAERGCSPAVSPDLTEEELIDVLRKEAKKRKEASEIFLKAKRTDLGEKEARELSLIENFLPQAMTEAEIEVIVKGVIDSGTKDFGGIMKAAMGKIGRKAEAGVVSGIVKRLLEE